MLDSLCTCFSDPLENAPTLGFWVIEMGGVGVGLIESPVSLKLRISLVTETPYARWNIGSQRRWVLGGHFCEDGCMIRKDNASQKRSLFKKMC